MNIYNVTYPYGMNGTITTITIALNAFDAQKQVEIKKVKRSKKGIKIETTTAFGKKGVKVAVASQADIENWIETLSKLEEPELIEKIQEVLERRAS